MVIPYSMLKLWRKSEKELAKEKLYISYLMMKHDSSMVAFWNRIQDLEDEKERLVARNKSLNHKIEEYKKLEPELQTLITHWKNLFYWVTGQHDKLLFHVEKLEHDLEKETQMREDGEVDLVNAMKTIQEREAELEAAKLALKEISEATQPIANMVEPPFEGVELYPLFEVLKDVRGKFTSYIQKMTKSVSKQLLSFIKSFNPQVDLAPVGKGIAEDCSDELFKQFMQETYHIVEELANHLVLE
nr:uncharacterized protein LOC117833987 [Setaria viridis]